MNNQILNTPMQDNDAGAKTIGDYLIALLATIWKEEDCFSGKRPFGNSDWTYDIYAALVRANLLDGRFDEEGFLEDYNEKRGKIMIAEAIQSLRERD